MISRDAVIALIAERLVEAEEAKDAADRRANLTMWAIADAWGQRFRTLKEQINKLEIIGEQADRTAGAYSGGGLPALVRNYDTLPYDVSYVLRRDRHAMYGRQQAHEPVGVPPGTPQRIQEDV